MIYLDTHVVVWLYAGEDGKFTARARRLIEDNELLISPMVLLELQYLKEIGRITADPALMVESLSDAVGLRYCPKSFLQVAEGALLVNWTRDPFDRMIVAAAQVGRDMLLTKDEMIHANYVHAAWV